ncbi:MAG: two-component regulator propeller domain-containing protein [Bacteroidota bacterium]
MKPRFLLSLFLLINSCHFSSKPTAQSEVLPTKKASLTKYGAGDIVTNGFVDSNGAIWFTTTNEGVFKYDGSSFLQMTETDGLCSNEVSSVVEDEEGVLWFGTAVGLCRFDGSSFEPIPLPEVASQEVSPETGFPSRSTTYVLNLSLDRNGNFWLGTDASGAYRFDGQNFIPFLRFGGRLQPDSVYHNCITSVLEDQSGNIWFTSMTHGAINRYDGEAMTPFGVEDGLLGDMITSSYEDQAGNIWFGSIQNLDGGISRYDGHGFHNYTVKDGLCDSNVVCFFEDESGIMWIGTGNGVCYFDGGSFFPLKHKGEFLGDIRFILKGPAGNLWFGGRYGVLWRYDGETLENLTYAKRNS